MKLIIDFYELDKGLWELQVHQIPMSKRLIRYKKGV